MIDVPTAKAHLRVDDAGEDALIGVYLAAAQGSVETATGKFLSPQAFVQRVAGFPACGSAVRLWKGPVTGIISVAYDDENGAEQTLADYRLVEGITAKLLPAYGANWPTTATGPGTVRITYTAGYATDEVPPALDQAVLYLVAHFYNAREAVVAGDRAAAVELPFAVRDLIAPYLPPGIG